MNRFVSNFTNKLDSKGRVSIPASPIDWENTRVYTSVVSTGGWVCR